MSQSIAIVQTDNASRYLQQLCKHWAHKFTVSFDANNGAIDFGEGQSVVLHADDSQLRVIISDAAAASLESLEKVVAEHIARFAFRENLTFDWARG